MEYIAQNPDTTLPFVSLENDISMMIYDSNDTPEVITHRERKRQVLSKYTLASSLGIHTEKTDT